MTSLLHARDPATNKAVAVSTRTNPDNGATMLRVANTRLRDYTVLNDTRYIRGRCMTASTGGISMSQTLATDAFIMHNSSTLRTVYLKSLHVNVSSSDSDNGNVVVELIMLKTGLPNLSGLTTFDGNKQSFRMTAEDAGNITVKGVVNNTVNTISQDVKYRYSQRFFTNSRGSEIALDVPIGPAMFELTHDTCIVVRISVSNSNMDSTASVNAILYNLDDDDYPTFPLIPA